MQIIPVIDLKQGSVVRGVAGRRDEYRPIVSQLASTARPGDIASAFVSAFGFTTAYVADLDAIAGAEPDWQSYADIATAGLSMWVDAGVNDVRRASQLSATPGVGGVIVGLETLRSVEHLAAMLGDLSSDRVFFSLDLMHGEPRTNVSAWRGASPLEIAEQVARIGVRQMIVLDLGDVGMQIGPSTHALAEEICQRGLPLRLIGGGGVRHRADLERLAIAGYHGALVASALHDGRFTSAPVIPDSR